jgi:hypothetical protein
MQQDFSFDEAQITIFLLLTFLCDV